MGLGCVAFDNLMEDLATFEISRAQVWQWLYHKILLDDGSVVTTDLVERIFDEELEKIISDMTSNLTLGSDAAPEIVDFRVAKEAAQKVFLSPNLNEFFSTTNS